MKARLLPLLLISAVACTHRLQDGEHTLTVISTNDVHGCWFDSTYTGASLKKSIFAINTYVDSVRKADGASNVVLLDAGDCLQGDNAAYYYNYVDTKAEHIFPRIMQYMRYDAVAVGNHDIETGHPVYDRVASSLKKADAPFLAGNAVLDSGEGTYFPLYKMVERAGLRIAVLGYTNANIKAWISEDLFSGMHFDSIAAIIQNDVNTVREKEHPDVVIAAMHSACGLGDGSILEAEALDALNKVEGVDWIVCGHDHRPRVEAREDRALLNSGSHCRYLAHGKMHVSVKDGKIVSKSFSTDLIPIDANRVDEKMRDKFGKDYQAVKSFTLREVGTLQTELRTRDSYSGPSAYLDMLHGITLGCSEAEISIAAPLSFDKTVKAGTLVFNDLFTIYPFENQLYIIEMSGQEIKDYLEASYDRWIQTPGEHVLRISPRDNPRTGEKVWSFDYASYNFDSAAGINYTVDVTKPRGSRVSISSMADGSTFSTEMLYRVGMTSYRASGGGNILDQIGIDTDRIAERTIAKHKEIRNIIYDYLMEHGTLDPGANKDALGKWEFVPSKARTMIEKDMSLLFN